MQRICVASAIEERSRALSTCLRILGFLGRKSALLRVCQFSEKTLGVFKIYLAKICIKIAWHMQLS